MTIYLTEYEMDDGVYGGEVNADSWSQAELILQQIGKKNEKVIGELVERIDIESQ